MPALQWRTRVVNVVVSATVITAWGWEFLNYWLIRPTPLWAYIPASIAYATAGLLALVLVARDVRHPSTPDLCLFLASVTLLNSPSALTRLNWTPVLWLGAALSAVMCIGAAAFARFAVLFPRPLERAEFQALARAVGRPATTRFGVFGLPWSAWRVVLPIVGLWCAVVVLDAGPRTELQNYIRPLAILAGSLHAGAVMLCLGHGAACFWKGHKLLTADEQRRADWIVWPLLAYGLWLAFQLVSVVAYFAGLGLAAGISGQSKDEAARELARAQQDLAGGSLSLLGGAVDAAVTLILVAGIAFAVFRIGAFEPKQVIRKTALYGMLTIALSALFILFEGITASLFVTRVGLPLEMSPAAAGAIVAIVFGPARRMVTGFSNRLVDRFMPATALAEGQRRDGVIVFSDITGYTSLTARDERAALTLASLLHKEARRIAGEHKGRVVKTIGDAVLMEFGAPASAVEACFELKRRYEEACVAAGLPPPALRTGINRGEIVVAPDGDVFGSTVNVAARLEGVAAPGEIVLSAAVTGGLRGAVSLEPLGERVLKNVPEPVVCFRASAA